MKKIFARKTIDKPQNAIVETTEEITSSPGAQRRKALLFQVSFGILLVSFGLLTLLIITVPSLSIDLSISRGFQSITNPGFAVLMTYISWIGYAPQSFIVSTIIVIIIIRFGYYWEGTVSLIVAEAVPALNLIVKVLIHRPRPSADLINIVTQITGYSFPSGHVMFYTGFFGFICFLTYTLLKPSWIRNSLLVACGSLIILVGISRIYLGNHWASDVLGAYLLGGACLMISISFYRWGKPRFFPNQPSARVKKRLTKDSLE